MSSFIVSHRTIDNAIAVIAETGYTDEFCRITGLPDWYPNMVGEHLLNLNAEAVEKRYQGEAVNWAPFRRTPSNVFSFQIPRLKQLQCLIYQCAEGSVPDSELFKLLLKVETKALKNIVQATSEWRDAPWG